MKEDNHSKKKCPSQKLIGKFEDLYKEYDKYYYSGKERQKA